MLPIDNIFQTKKGKVTSDVCGETVSSPNIFDETQVKHPEISVDYVSEDNIGSKDDSNIYDWDYEMTGKIKKKLTGNQFSLIEITMLLL